ncbi:MAG: hypothetical protein E7339_02505 [Clostridiales bacterium]|nr:hypothetical protein [Clostridiales bacterium]
MRKLLAILIAFCSAFLITGLAACEDDIDHSGSEVIIGGDLSGYNIHPDLSDFSDVVELNGVVHYEDIKLNCAKLHGTNDGSNKYHGFIVEVREDMIVSIDSTDTVGDKKLVIAYAGRELVISFTVKYKVSFLSMGEVFDTQYVLTPEEIQFPNPPKQEGYTFANYWETEVPEELTDNMQFEAHYYVNAFEAPKLETVELTYDPNATVTFGDFALPSNEHGKWVYVEDESTVIEGAGKHLIDVKFIPVNEFVAPKTAQLVVNVAPKHATFEILSNSFVYDGNSYFPEFTVTDDIEVEVLGEAKVEAGTYTYALLVADSNYEGHYSGSFTIAKPDVTITVSSNSMKYAEVMPKLEYSVEGFANEALLDIKLVQPNVISIGNYEITAIVQNKNVNATVINGILTVEKGNLADITNPTLSTDETPAIYESPISSIAITGDYRGVWTWKNPDLIIDSVESITAMAVFTPNNENYNLIEREITITNLDKRTLEITILNSDYVYTGEEFTIEYAIEDGKVVTVEGLLAETNAGSYKTVLSINSKYYKGSKEVTLFIDKATPETDFTAEFTKIWNGYLKLSDITLAEGYVWKMPSTLVNNYIGTKSFPATFIPNDTANYYTVDGEFAVTVEKATGVLQGVKPSYTFTYNKDSAQVISGITSIPTDGIIKYTYLLNGEEVSELRNAGTYSVTVDLLESTYYTSAVITTEVVINKIVNADVVTLEQSAIYGAKMNSLALPTSEYGVWAWEGADENTTVGNVGTHVYVAVYTPNDPANYEARKVNVEITVIKQTVYEPTVQAQMVYTGSEITALSVADDALYTADGILSATNVGSYSITLTLKDADNYKWSGSANASIELTYAITQAPNAITALAIEGWTYGEEVNAPTITANFGASTVVYYYAPVGSQSYSTAVPVNAGSYNLKAVIAETANYAGAERVVTNALTIAKATLNVSFDKHYTETWYNGLKLSNIALEAGYSWKEDSALEVGAEQEFAVVYTPEDTINYNVEEGTFKVTVNRRLVTLNGVQDGYNHVYNGSAYVITGVTASPNVELVYTYSSGNAPVNAGEYTVTITVKDSAHYTLGTQPDSLVRTIVIAKADVDTVVSYDATYLDTLGLLELPTSEFGVWTWEAGNDALVGNAGEREHVAVFTSNSANHNSLKRSFKVTVAKKEISKPTLEVNSFVYTGSAFELLGETDLYTVKGNVQTDVGNYTITVTLKDANNYVWSAQSADPTFAITQATTEIKNFSIEGWTFGDEAKAPNAESNFGTVKFLYAGANLVYSETVPVNAGEYFVKALVEGTNNYTSDETEAISFTIAKAEYTLALAKESYTVDWFNGITLAAITDLPKGYSWTNANQALVAGTTAIKYGVTYVDLSGNYNPAYGEFEVTVNKLASSIAVESEFGGSATTEYTQVYNGSAFVISVSASHNEAEVVYTVNGAVVSEISLTNAGTYEIAITLAETAHYLASSWTKTVVINQARATYTLPVWAPSVDSIMSDLALPVVNETLNGGYSWIWMDENAENEVDITQKVGGAAETVPYTLRFVSNDLNYESFDVKVAITVGKIMVTPTLEQNTFTYTGETFTVTVLGIDTDVEYTVAYLTDFINKGDHVVEITMSAESYETHSWTGSTSATITLPVVINASVNTVESIEITGWTYDKTASEPQVETKFGGAVSYKYYNVNNPNNTKEGIPSDAGTYVLIATSSATANYASASRESAAFTIAKAEYTLALAEKSYTVDWFNEITLATITDLPEGYSWTNANQALVAGTTAVKYGVTYVDLSGNYNPAYGEFEVTVNRLGSSITVESTFGGNATEEYTHLYNGSAFEITARASHTEGNLVYTVNDEVVSEISLINAGEYDVVISLAQSDHYLATSWSKTVVIKQATNTWTEAPSINKAEWIYNTQAGVASAEAKFGTVITEYRLQTASEYVSAMPVDAGKYFVRFRVEGNNDYTGLTKEIAFVITQAEVTASISAEGFVYNNVEYVASVSLDVAGVEYEVSGNKQSTAGTHTVTVTLKNANYKFENGTSETVLKFTIAKASVVLGEVSVTHGKYGEQAPSATVSRTDSGTFDIEIKYYYDANYNGTYANELSALTELSNAGTYYVKAVVVGDEVNYNGYGTEPVEVLIAQADTDESVITGKYSIEWYNGLTLSAITPYGSDDGTYEWVEAGTTALAKGNYTFQVKFTPKDKNYASVTRTVSVEVTALVVTVPGVELTDGTTDVATSPIYNGNAWRAKSAEEEADYVITSTSATNAGEVITVTIALKYSANSEWADGTTANKQVTFTVQKAPNAISSFTYDANTGAMSVEALNKEGGITYYYLVDGVFTTTMPTIIGKYDVKVVIAESANYLAVEKIFTEAVTLMQATIIPSFALDSNVYTGATITGTVTLSRDIEITITSEDEGITINGMEVSVVNAGTYTITLTMADDLLALYKWDGKDAEVASTTIEFTVNSAENGWAEGYSVENLLDEYEGYDASLGYYRDYDGSESIVDDSVQWFKHGDVIITYHSVDSNGNETGEISGYPTNAGKYRIKLTVKETNDFAGFSASVDLEIKGVETKISTLPTYTQNQYQDQFPFTADKYGATSDPVAELVTGGTVEGKFIYGEYTIVNGTNEQGVYVEFTLTFEPNDTNYAKATATVTIPLKKVAHVTTDQGATRTYYGTVEEAIKAATSGEVWVLPDKTGNVVIANDVTVASGVTLVLPFAIKSNDYVPRNDKGGYADTDGRNPEGKVYNLSGGQVQIATKAQVDSNVILKAGVTLTVNGELEIAGRLGSGESGKFFAGQTYMDYAQMTLEAGAKIVVNNGAKLNLTGYIRGDEDGQVIINNGADLYIPFILNDHHGGSHLSAVALYKKAAPFNRYQFRNIESALLRINYGGEMYVYANLFGDADPAADGSYNHAEALFIASTGVSSGTGVIHLSNANSYMTARFTPSPDYGDSNYPYTEFYKDVCKINLYGGATAEQLALTLMGYTVKSKNFDFPVPITYDITLNDGDYKMNNAVKLLPGAKLTVEKGATLTATKLTVYTECFFALTDFGEHRFYCEKAIKIPAEFTVNGVFNGTTFGGIIKTSVPGAKVTVTNTATSSVKEASSQGKVILEPSYITYTHNLSLAKAGNKGGTYTAKGTTYYSAGNDTWYTDGKKYITYDSNDGTSVTDKEFNVTTGTPFVLTADYLPAITRNYHSFAGWYMTDVDSNNEVKVDVGTELYEDVIIYAKWTPLDYTVKYVSEVGTTPAEDKFTYTTNKGGELLPELVDESGVYNFAGWYTTSDFSGSAVGNFDAALLAANSSNVVTLYAKWTSDIQYTVTYVSGQNVTKSVSEKFTADQLGNVLNQTVDAFIGKDPTSYDGASTSAQYHYGGGWVKPGTTTLVTEITEADFNENHELTLEVYWIKKATITGKIIAKDNASKSDGTYTATYEIYFNGVLVENKTGIKTAGEYPFTYYVEIGSTYEVKGTNTSNKVASLKSGTLNSAETVKLGDISVYFDNTAEESSSCFTGDTLITLADGTQKRGDQLTVEDTLLVFNHETGEYEAAGIIFIENDGMAEYNVIHLEFSNGTSTKLIYEHGYFDLTLNKYVYITEDNYADFIGHEFAILAGDSYESVTLTNAYVAKEYTGCYSLVTVYHLNYFVDGLFSMPGGITGLFNMFEYGEGLVYDQAKMQADIEEYGLYTYEDFAEYLPYEVYAAFPAPQLKVAVGKGMITFDEILGYIEKYLVKNEVI